ncbi:hypothetical protein KAFR_0J01220 [Kazachstania africana CBS 2517]|uniref:Uncharacterized protein n=1 Tax=Kazachstania africana (strain ATCC 22294 / BCRC 22015 / CBS 2517 / CECT 1963 / NBRC 1671 / NRRL Y-8276) TaxID=1071382 RepID=H2B0N9_KAZAF|nr:hypothetical protein KAFR_0J01220 [Kazachstania africana CBS 2517]CCF60189.1 hypothetical protein KAFR_0J01220 [Kazachstania africana CBS 2517]
MRALVFSRRFFTATKLLNEVKTPLAKSYSNIFNHSCFVPLAKNIPSKLDGLEPYEVSKRIIEALNEANITSDEAAGIHNKMIEELSRYNYGIATIHSEKLGDISRKITLNALIELIRNNPGRVKTSWEIFMDHKESFDEIPDSLIQVVMDKQLNANETESLNNQRELNMMNLVQILTLLGQISNRSLVNIELVDKLTTLLLEGNASVLLPFILQFKPALSTFDRNLVHLTPFQLYEISKCYSHEDLQKYPDLFHKILLVLGKNTSILLTSEEQEISQILEQNLKLVNSRFKNSRVSCNSVDGFNTENQFFHLVEQVIENGTYKTNFQLCKSILRLVGTREGKTDEFLRLYDMFVKTSCSPTDEQGIMFEAFLALSYSGYKTSKKESYNLAKTYIPESVSKPMYANILRVMIILESKFDINEALNIYNSNIQELQREKDNATQLSSADVVTEALILAFLTKKDVDFSRVVFDGALGEKILSGATAVKRIKKMLSNYGEAVENDNFDEFLQNEALSYLANI